MDTTSEWFNILFRVFLLIVVWRHVTVVKILVKATPSLVVLWVFSLAFLIASSTFAWIYHGPEFANVLIPVFSIPIVFFGGILALYIFMWVFAGGPICIRSFWKLATEKSK